MGTGPDICPLRQGHRARRFCVRLSQGLCEATIHMAKNWEPPP